MITMKAYFDQIIYTFKSAGDPAVSKPMKAYMKNQFEFIGIKSPERRELSRPFLNRNMLPPPEEGRSLIQAFWALPEREFQYFAMELAEKYIKSVNISWIEHYEYLITHKSWWDTVDFLATTLMGNYFRCFPEMIPQVTDKWMGSGDIWLQRSCLLFQLKYKSSTDTNLLTSFILPLSESKEFFIAKAIGWSLREYSKTDPDWVRSFVLNHKLQPLSKKEGLKRISGYF